MILIVISEWRQLSWDQKAALKHRSVCVFINNNIFMLKTWVYQNSEAGDDKLKNLQSAVYNNSESGRWIDELRFCGEELNKYFTFVLILFINIPLWYVVSRAVVRGGVYAGIRRIPSAVFKWIAYTVCCFCVLRATQSGILPLEFWTQHSIPSAEFRTTALLTV